MSITLDLAPETEAYLREKAARDGQAAHNLRSVFACVYTRLNGMYNTFTKIGSVLVYCVTVQWTFLL